MTGEPTEVAEAVARAFRVERAAVLATLIRQVGDFQLAEDALQDAFVAAVPPGSGRASRQPAGWLDHHSPAAGDRPRAPRPPLAGRTQRLVELTALDGREENWTMDGTGLGGDPDSAVGDDRLRLIFTCCHPALGPDARVALTLRTLGGLTTAEIARAFLVAEPTMGKRIVRAKRKIADAPSPTGSHPTSCPNGSAACCGSSISSSTRGTRPWGGPPGAWRPVGEAIRLGAASDEADARRGRGVGPAGHDAAPRRPP